MIVIIETAFLNHIDKAAAFSRKISDKAGFYS
jgi:hypothetical protein